MDVMKQTIEKSGGKWPTSDKDLIAEHLRAFTTFINSIDFDNLQYISFTNVLKKDVTREMAYNLW